MALNIVLAHFSRLYQFQTLIVILFISLRKDTALCLVLATGLVMAIDQSLMPSTVYKHTICPPSSGFHRVKNSWNFRSRYLAASKLYTFYIKISGSLHSEVIKLNFCISVENSVTIVILIIILSSMPQNLFTFTPILSTYFEHEVGSGFQIIIGMVTLKSLTIGGKVV